MSKRPGFIAAAARRAPLLRALALCGAVIAAAAAPAAAKTLIYCAEASPGGFDPALYTDGATYAASSQTIYSRLVGFAHGSSALVPALAESWDISADGRVYTFHLRRGVKFQQTPYFTPSREMNADDVVFSFDRQVNKADPWHNYLEGQSYQYYDSMDMPNIIKTVKKLDDYTVQFTLNQAEAPFLADLAMDFASIVSKEYADRLAASGKMRDFNAKPVGTGPFMLVAYQKDAVVRFRANPTFWRGRQKLDNLVFAITTDNAVRAQKMRAGECQVMAYPVPTDIPALAADKNITLMRGVDMNVSYLAYNTRKAPFDKVEVRRALNMAVNKQALVDIVFGGFGTPAVNPLPPSLWGYNKAIAPDMYDLAKARAMLEQAGVKNLRLQLWALPVSRPYLPNGRRAAELIQSDWKAIGVETDIITMEWGEYLKAATDKNRDSVVMMGWIGDNSDPDNFLSTLNSCAAIGTANYAMWCDKNYDALIDKAKRITDQGERARLYEQAQVIFKEQAPWLALAYGTTIMPVAKRVKNFYVNVQAIRFDDVDID